MSVLSTTWFFCTRLSVLLLVFFYIMRLEASGQSALLLRCSAIGMGNSLNGEYCLIFYRHEDGMQKVKQKWRTGRLL